MKIGLVRHFEVNCSHKHLMTAKDFREWVDLYDSSPIKITDTIIHGRGWEACYCSDLSRAAETARHIYKGTIMETPSIKEVPIAPIFELHIKLPYIFWLAAGRLAWLFSHQSQLETVKQTEDRVEKFISDVIAKSDDKVLIVAHGFLMRQIQKDLNNRGFSSEDFKRARHGKIYVFENDKI